MSTRVSVCAAQVLLGVVLGVVSAAAQMPNPYGPSITLDGARTPDALRRAYRTLARRYHPDSHPGTTAAERAHLARLFAVATEHYRSLAASFDIRTH